LNNIMKIDAKAVQEYKDVVVFCLNDEDVSIRMRALDLLIGMVNKRNITDVVDKLIEKIETAEGDFREGLIETIVEICSQNNYVFVSDFEWYISILVKLSGCHGTKHGSLLRNQLMDVCIRVKMVREFGVQSMVCGLFVLNSLSFFSLFLFFSFLSFLSFLFFSGLFPFRTGLEIQKG